MKKSSAVALGLGAAAGVAAGFELSKFSNSLHALHRVDGQGALYYAEYKGSYYDPLLRLPLKLFAAGGCSSFVCLDEKGEPLTARNYDLPHKDKNGEVTGLNVVLRCSPKGKYRSLGVADAAWLSMLKLPYYSGALDEGQSPRIPTALLPWLTMDGINEKGLVLSIHALDLKEGETPVHQKHKGHENVTVNELLRLGLDECCDVDSFLALAESVNLRSLAHADFHLFATDASGKAAVLEWRNNELLITSQDAVTNYYVSADDAQDCYLRGQLKERFGFPPVCCRPYRYGYGHGYSRFFTLAETLRDCGSTEDTLAAMSRDDAAKLLEKVSQEFDGGDLTSCTQYSALYHHAALSLDIFSMREYDKMYSFTL